MTYIYIYIYVYIYIYIYIYWQAGRNCHPRCHTSRGARRDRDETAARAICARGNVRMFTPSPPTKSLGFRGFDSSRLLILRGGILISVKFHRGSPGKFDSRTLNRKTLSRWTGRSGALEAPNLRDSPSKNLFGVW